MPAGVRDRPIAVIGHLHFATPQLPHSGHLRHRATWPCTRRSTIPTGRILSGVRNPALEDTKTTPEPITVRELESRSNTSLKPINGPQT